MQSLSSKGRQIVISHGLKQPRGLALDPDGGYMFFSDWHESTSHIEKAWLDGSHRRVLVSLEKGAWPNGIVVDAKHKRLYWTEGSRSFIKSVALDGKQNFASNFGQDLMRNDGVRVFEPPFRLPKQNGNSLYCNSLYGRKISVFRVPRHNESFFDVQLSVVSDSVVFGQMGIRAVSLNRIPEGISPCQTSNGGCSHICVKLPHGERSCVCPVGYELQIDRATCIMPAAFLIYTQSITVNSANSIMRISLEATPANNHRINIADMTSAPVNNSQRIFWASEGRGRSIRSLLRSAFFNGSGLETVYEGNAVNYIAVDWITSNIYWLANDNL
ncbi:unnamed protein product [Onchocerca flexuosa]|uniref:EGF-like domain-containing protein n=1 Tax=Onchocerca flexuosa TaxID=387005 RepID=A0A183HFA0_9BILA|nr:unnamed protein product [Onchocerca flexuosa]